MTDTAAGRGMQVGFVGTGTMGNPMAANLLRAGHQLTVHDVRQESAHNLLEVGARWADTPRAVANASEVTFLSLPAPADVDEVVRRHDGILAGARPGSAVFDLSTNSPEVVRALAARAGEQDVQLLDAPVSGGVAGARKGTLALMVGGDEATFQQFQPVLEAIGNRIFYMGSIGAGSVAKLVNNLLFLNGALGTVEALVIAAKAGVNLNVLRDVVQASSGGSFVWDYGSRAILRDRLAPSFTVALATKDAELAVTMADDLGAPTAVASHVRDQLRHYRATGYAADDVLAIVKALEQATGVIVRGDANE